MPAAEVGIDALVAAGYAVLAPIRRGHNGNPGPYWEDLVPSPWGSPAMGPSCVAALAGECDDALAGLARLRAEPSVDGPGGDDRVVVRRRHGPARGRPGAPTSAPA